MVVPDSMNLALWQTCMLLGKIVYLAEVNISKCLEKDIVRKILLDRNKNKKVIKIVTVTSSLVYVQYVGCPSFLPQ